MVTHLTGALLAALLVSSAVIAPVAGAKPHTTRVSVSSLGAQARGESGQPALSATGRYVAFS